MSRILLVFILVFSFSISGCVPAIPKDAFKLKESSLEARKMQTRKFETKDEMALLSAGVSQLQDMGYMIDETEKHVGLVVGSKDADATSTGQVVGMVLLAALAGTQPVYDTNQKIRVSFVTIPSGINSGAYYARITFQRIVWNNQGQIARAETLQEPEMYQEFFSKLSKSVFLEANNI